MQMNNTHCELLKTLLVLTNTSSGNLTFCNHHASRFFFLSVLSGITTGHTACAQAASA